MSYPIDQKNRWQYKQVPNLLGGINTIDSENQIKDNQTIQLDNIIIKTGNIQVDTGYKTFGSVVVGHPQAEYNFIKRGGSAYELLITTSTVYAWNTTILRWELIRGTATTTTTSGYPAGTTVIVVASAAGFTTGDLIAVTLDNGDQVQATATMVGTTFTLATAVPVGRTIANGAVVDRAVVLNGDLDFQVSVLTVPGSDVAVFTNGIDIIKQFDGTHCIDVANLPSSGNTTCRSLVLYNTALFLLNTTEGGTNYPQRVRRSDQTDITNWTTGTAGIDSLLDTADAIQCGEVLGPYLVVYRDYSITRGSFIGQTGLNYFWETTITDVGVVSSGAVVNMGDYHIMISSDNIYEYRGDYNITPIGDNLFYAVFSIDSDINSQFLHRIFTTYIPELQEVWVLYPTVTSTTGECNRVIKYNIGTKAYYTRTFADSFVGYGFYESQNNKTWASLVGTWIEQTWKWSSRRNTTTIRYLTMGQQSHILWRLKILQWLILYLDSIHLRCI
jgi:hypothetical protein